MATGVRERQVTASAGPVLIVEDDERTAGMLREMLEALGHDVAGVVGTPGEALKAVERIGPALVMMDIGLPGSMDGVETAREIRARRPVPVIFVTAHGDPDTLERAVTTHPYGYLTKPFDLRALESTVELALLRHRMEERLRASEERFRALFEDNVAGVFRRTRDGTLLEVNDAFASLLGYEEPGRLVGRSLWELCTPEGGPDGGGEPREPGEKTVNRVLRSTGVDGSTRWLLENSVPVRDPAGDAPVVIGTVVDITDRKRLESEYERLAHHDPLTRLANRRLLADRARQALALAEREDREAAIVYFDLDRFKSINDNLGHEAGDRVLTEVAHRMRRLTRETDTVARVGGDEFAVLLPNVEGVPGGKRAARRIRASLEEPIRLDDRVLKVGAQLGVAIYPRHARDFEGLLRAADQAMYRGKGGRDRGQGRRGGGRGPDVAVAGDLSPAEEFTRALDEGQLQLHYQPIHDLRRDRVVGMEALVRWSHPSRGVLEASEFLLSVQDASVLRRLDRWVLDRVLWRLRARDEGGPWLSLNLSASSLQDEQLMGRLEEAVRHGSAGHELVVEVTEHAAVMDPEATFERLSRLRSSGLRLALDDFGTGHSSLAYLRHMPIDLLKLDRIFLEDVEDDPSSGRVARGVFELGRAAGMRVVAEGVERESQLEWLRRNEGELAQGRYLAPPEALPPSGGGDRPDG